MLVDPGRHGVVELVRHQHREGEVVQGSLGRAFPLGGVGSDLDQLSGEWQVVGSIRRSEDS